MEVEGDGGEEGVTVCGTLREAPAGAEPTAVAVDTCEDVGASEGGRRRHCLLYTSPSPRDRQKSRMPSSA